MHIEADKKHYAFTHRVHIGPKYSHSIINLPDHLLVYVCVMNYAFITGTSKVIDTRDYRDRCKSSRRSA